MEVCVLKWPLIAFIFESNGHTCAAEWLLADRVPESQDLQLAGRGARIGVVRFTFGMSNVLEKLKKRS